MKKHFLVLLLLSVFLFSGCEKEKDVMSKTTYQVYNNTSVWVNPRDPYQNGSLYEVVVFCFSGDDVVREDYYDKIAVSVKTGLKEVPNTVTKIRVSYRLVPEQSISYELSGNRRLYLTVTTFIERGKNVVAEITDNSMSSGSMVKENTNDTSLKLIRQNFSIKSE